MKTKNLIKVLPGVLALCLLAGCDNTPKVSDQNKTFISGAATQANQPDNYQKIFNKLYNEEGDTTISNEILYRVAKTVLAESSNWTDAEIKAEIANRVQDHFDEFYSDSYRTDGLFDEELLISSLTNSGFNITKKSAAAFKETVTNLVGYQHLQSFLTYDYSDYIASLEKGYYTDLFNEEYILSQKAGSSTSYYTNKDVRKVAYFSWNPDTSTEREQYADQFQDYVDANLDKDFKTVVTGQGGLEEQWKIKKLKDLAKDFAMINASAKGYNTAVKAVNEMAEYPLPAAYESVIVAYEKTIAADSKYGFKDIYTVAVIDASKDDKATEFAEVKEKLNTYSDSNSHSIYEGYYQKQLAIINEKYYVEQTYTSDSSSVIDSTVTDAIESLTAMYENGSTKTNYLDLASSGTVVFKSGDVNYILSAEKVNDSSSAADKKLAAKELAKASSNTKNAIYFYLTDLAENGKFEINNQDVYDYFNETYGFGEED